MHMSKNQRLMLGVFVIILALVIGFYQLKLKTVKGNRTVPVVVASKNVIKGDTLGEDNITIKEFDISSHVDGNFKNINEVIGKKANENFRENEQILKDKIVPEEEWTKEGKLQLVSVQAKVEQDSFTAFEVKPTDIIDIYLVPSSNKTTGNNLSADSLVLDTSKPYLEKVEITDTKNAEGISYKDRDKKVPFKPVYATLWLEQEQVKKIVKMQSDGYVFKMVIYGNRTNIDSSSKTSDATTVIFK